MIPSIRLHDGASLGTNQYIIKIRGEEVAPGEILVDYYLAWNPQSHRRNRQDRDIGACLRYSTHAGFCQKTKEMAGNLRLYCDHTADLVMLTHLSETIKKHTYELLNRSETI